VSKLRHPLRRRYDAHRTGALCRQRHEVSKFEQFVDERSEAAERLTTGQITPLVNDLLTQPGWSVDDEHSVQLVMHELAILREGDLFYVEPDFMSLIEEAAKTFEHEPLLPSDLIVPCGFVRLPRSIYIEPPSYPQRSGSEDDRYIDTFRAFGWGSYADNTGILLCYYAGREDIPDLVAPFVPTRFTQWVFEGAEHRVVPEAGTLMREWHATYTFARVFFRLVMQRIADVSVLNPDRATRKRAKRAGVGSSVNVVRLRRPEHLSDPGPDHHKVEWSHQWIVSGHWRWQWYPSIQAHRQIWISPYVKGPEGKELIIKPRVFDVAV
jgi:hypothetical protein